MAAEVDVTRARNGSRLGLLLVCLVLVATGAGCRGCDKAKDTPGPVEDVAANATRIAAMLSIHAHARWPDADDRVKRRLMPLPEAASYLKNMDQGYFADSRRRRAIAKLAGYGLGRQEVDVALERLGANVSTLHKQLDQCRPTAADAVLPSNAIVSKAYAADAPLPPNEIESKAYDLEPFHSLHPPNCPTTNLEVYVPDNGLPVATGSARISVGRDLKEVARAIDPQSWDVCSKFFKPPERTYLSKPDGTPDASQTPGAPYGPSLLFEFYTCPAMDEKGNPTGCDAWFKNFLKVITWWSTTSKTYDVRYTLDSFVDGDILNTGKQNAELTTDVGGAEVEVDGGTGQVIASGWKTLVFKNLAATGMSKALFTVMLDEVTGELAELACCPIP